MTRTPPGALALVAVAATLAAACGGAATAAHSGASTGTGPRPDPCTPAECGPAMGMPNYLCVDGTMGGPGPCVRNAAGVCGWSVRTCTRIDPCPLDACDRSPLPATTCADGSQGGPLGICTRTSDGRCVEVVRSCPVG